MSRLIFILLVLSVLTSYTEYHFNQALPVGSKDITRIPKKYRGTWISTESDSTTYVKVEIGKDYFHRVWQELTTTAKSDLDSNIEIIEGLIYANEHGTLHGGYEFSDLGDSLQAKNQYHDYQKLGRTAVLRKVKQGYLLSRVDGDMKWWVVRFIDTRDKNLLKINSIAEIDTSVFPAHQTLKNHNDYLKVDWSVEDVERFIDRGGFSETLLKLVRQPQIIKQ